MTEIKETGNRKWAFSDQKSQKEANFVFMADLFHSFTENLKVKLEVIVIMFFPLRNSFSVIISLIPTVISLILVTLTDKLDKVSI